MMKRFFFVDRQFKNDTLAKRRFSVSWTEAFRHCHEVMAVLFHFADKTNFDFEFSLFCSFLPKDYIKASHHTDPQLT
jgi:hypothetical protein